MSLSARSARWRTFFHLPLTSPPLSLRVRCVLRVLSWWMDSARATRVVRTPRAEPANPMPGPFLHAIRLQPLHILTDCSVWGDHVHAPAHQACVGSRGSEADDARSSRHHA